MAKTKVPLRAGGEEFETLHALRARAKKLLVVGGTGRTPRGWWGDQSVGLLLPNGFFDANRPELLPVRMPLRSTALGHGARKRFPRRRTTKHAI